MGRGACERMRLVDFDEIVDTLHDEEEGREGGEDVLRELGEPLDEDAALGPHQHHRQHQQPHRNPHAQRQKLYLVPNTNLQEKTIPLKLKLKGLKIRNFIKTHSHCKVFHRKQEVPL
jgi:hypothetical protein